MVSTSGSEDDRGGVKIGAKLSLSRPGKRIPLDFRLYGKKIKVSKTQILLFGCNIVE